MLIFLVFLLHFTSILSSSIPTNFAISANNVGLYEKNITIKITIPPKDFFYKDYFHFSVDHPGVELSEWKTNIQAKTIYDPTFKETKQIYYKHCIITVTATAHKQIDDLINLHVIYFQRSEQKIKQFLWPFSLSKQKIIKHNNQQHALDETKIFENKKTELNFTDHYFIKYLHVFKNYPLYELLFISIILLCILLSLHSSNYGIVGFLHRSDAALNIFLSIILYQLGLLCALFLISIIFLGLKHCYPNYSILYQNTFSIMYLSSSFLLFKNHTKQSNNNTSEFNASHFLINGIKMGMVNSLSIVPSLTLLFDGYKTIEIIPFCWIILCISIGMIIKDFFIQTKNPRSLLQELMNIISVIGEFLFFGLALYMLHINNKPIVITLTLLILSIYFGCSFIKMSTKLEHHKLRSFTSIIGSTLIITSVYLFFIMLQKIDLIFFNNR